MARVDNSRTNARVFTIVLVALVTTMLYLARDILIPVALATLLSFLLAPLVSRLERWGLGRVPSVVAVVVMLFVSMGLFGWIVTDQLISLGGNLDSYRGQVQKKIQSIAPAGQGIIGKAQATINEVTQLILDAPGTNKTKVVAPKAAPAPDEPVPVEIVEARNPLAFLPGILGNVFGSLVTSGVVILLVFFMLIEREDLRNRIIRLIGARQIHLTTQAMFDAAHRVSRYLRMQLIVNAAYGVLVAIGLYFIGVPNAILWGVLATVFRYIPYLGAWIAAAVPLALSMALFDGWTRLAVTGGMFVLLELVFANFVEPFTFGASTGISTIGILLAAIFWTWLWGGIGLVLATPMTVCIAVIGRYVPQFEFFDVLLSDEPVLPPGTQYYQRLLAQDLDDASRLVDKFLQDHSLEHLYDEMFLPALVLAEQDAHHGELTTGQQQYIHDAMRETVEELGDRAMEQRHAHAVETSDAAGDEAPSSRSVICLPARDAADELAALMLGQLLEARGRGVQIVSMQALASEMLDHVGANESAQTCISAVPPFAMAHALYLCKRLRARFPHLKIAVGLWQQTDIGPKTEARLRAAAADRMFTTLHDALEHL